MAGNPALLPVDSVCDLRLVLICTLYGSATIAFVACRLHRTEEGTGQTDDDLICDGFGLVGRCLFFGTRHPKRTGYRKEYSAEDARNRCPLRSDIKLDDGWPESVEEQDLLLLVWRRNFRNSL